MNSRLYLGQVVHTRVMPVEHRFRYPAFVFAIDIDELPELDRRVRLFAHNRGGIFSLHEGDYLGAGGDGLRAKLRRHIDVADARVELDRVDLVSTPRFLGHTFNPVSFYYCYNSEAELSGIVVEVNNTFGEAHVYVLPAAGAVGTRGDCYRYVTPKRFHVSPFNDMEGDYEFHFSSLGERIDVRIDIRRREGKAFAARLSGHARSLDNASLCRLAATYPLTAALTLPRIMWQAYKLHYRKGLPLHAKPEPTSPQTFAAARPAYISELTAPKKRHWGARFVHRYLSRLKHGSITLRGPGGTIVRYGNPSDELRATMEIHHTRFFWRAIAGGDVGFAESFMDGDWSCDDLTSLIRIFALNRDNLDNLTLATALPRRLANRAYHVTRRNTLAGNRRNIQDHYDLGNEFFRLFLDPSMTYSCAVFPTGTETLEQAQQLKIQTMIDKARIRPSDHVLEIGSGWGSMALAAARQTGCRVTTLTLSDEQKRWVEARVAAAGLEDRVSVHVTDYRRIEGVFDRIVSVEMLEAVGHDNLAPYFAACDRLLRPGGRAAIQVITIRDEAYAEYRRGCDFIQRYIFPGGNLPCWDALSRAITAAPGLTIDNVENIGHHYARTLSEWRDAFNANAESILALGFDRSFLRRWNYYFSYCEAGFRTRMLGDLQFVLTK